MSRLESYPDDVNPCDPRAPWNQFSIVAECFTCDAKFLDNEPEPDMLWLIFWDGREISICERCAEDTEYPCPACGEQHEFDTVCCTACNCVKPNYERG